VNSNKPSDSVLKRLASGYGKLGLTAGLWLAAGVAVFAGAAAIVWPLWALALRYTGVYNLVFAGMIAACALAGVFFSVRRKLAAGANPAAMLRRALAVSGIALSVIVLILSLYFTIAFALRGFILGALPAGLVFIALSGYLFFGRKRQR
jgi:hypothetical protein